jgi:hypothetical protein
MRPVWFMPRRTIMDKLVFNVDGIADDHMGRGRSCQVDEMINLFRHPNRSLWVLVQGPYFVVLNREKEK